MSSIKDLKENTLIVLRDHYFILDKSGFISTISSTTDYTTVGCSKSLILIKKINDKAGYSLPTWECFCHGKFIKFQLIKGDFGKFTIYDVTKEK
jgi:hypothetical protein